MKTTIKTATGTVSLTANEVTALLELWDSSYANGHDFAISNEIPSISPKSRAGVIASLTKKGLINNSHCPELNLSQAVFTDKGKSLFTDFNTHPTLHLSTQEIEMATKLATTAPAAAKSSKKSAVTPTVTEKAKKTVEKATGTAPAGRAKKDGLRDPQVRILKVLAKGKALSRKEISEKAKVDNAFCTEYLGSANPEIREKNDLKFHSLISLKLIKLEVHEEDGKKVNVFSITEKGKKEAGK